MLETIFTGLCDEVNLDFASAQLDKLAVRI